MGGSVERSWLGLGTGQVLGGRSPGRWRGQDMDSLVLVPISDSGLSALCFPSHFLFCRNIFISEIPSIHRSRACLDASLTWSQVNAHTQTPSHKRTCHRHLGLAWDAVSLYPSVAVPRTPLEGLDPCPIISESKGLAFDKGH